MRRLAKILAIGRNFRTRGIPARSGTWPSLAIGRNFRTRGIPARSGTWPSLAIGRNFRTRGIPARSGTWPSLAIALTLAFASYAGAAEPLRVLTSFLPMEIFTRNVVGDTPGVTVVSMLPASMGCPHDYALTPGDMKKIASADLFVANGFGMEEFLGEPVRRANPKIRIVETAHGVRPIRGGHAGSGEVNPHTWVSPRNAILQVREIERALSAARPAGAPAFRRNADAYVSRLSALAAEFEAAAKTFRRRNIVTFHNVFDYLARDLGLTVVGEIETAPGQEPSAGEIRKLSRTIRERKVPAVFSEPQYSPKLAEALAREAGVPVRVMDPVATGSPALTTYEDAMRRNLSTLKEALSAR